MCWPARSECLSGCARRRGLHIMRGCMGVRQCCRATSPPDLQIVRGVCGDVWPSLTYCLGDTQLLSGRHSVAQCLLLHATNCSSCIACQTLTQGRAGCGECWHCACNGQCYCSGSTGGLSVCDLSAHARDGRRDSKAEARPSGRWCSSCVPVQYMSHPRELCACMYAKSELLCRFDRNTSGHVMLGRRLTDEDFRTTCMGVLSALVCRYGSECGAVQLRRLLNRLGCSVGPPRCNWSQRAGTSETCVCDCVCAEQVDISGPTEHMRYTHSSCMCRSITEVLSSTDYKELIGQCSSLCQQRRRPRN